MNSAAFLSDFHHGATIGATPNNGVDRQAATAEDAQTRDWFAARVHDAGWELRVDGIGNMFGLLEWTPGAPYVLIGSHLDSQPLGGRFDGAYGVIAALHAARRLDADVAGGSQKPRFNLAVVNWFNEEGGRFATGGDAARRAIGSPDRRRSGCRLTRAQRRAPATVWAATSF